MSEEAGVALVKAAESAGDQVGEGWKPRAGDYEGMRLAPHRGYRRRARVGRPDNVLIEIRFKINKNLLSREGGGEATPLT